MQLTRRQSTLVLAAIFIVTFLLNAWYPISRPPQWLARAIRFEQAVEEADWPQTYQMYHPGYTTMAVGAVALEAYDHAKPAFDALLDVAAPPYLTDYGCKMVVAVWGLALMIAALNTAIAAVMRRLGGWTFALVACGLLTFSPFVLSQSRSFHVDAPVAFLMILSGLLILLYAQSGKLRHLVASGLVAGFALLTKTPAVFLVPYTGLTLGVVLLMRLRAGWGDHPDKRLGWIVRETWIGLVRPGLLWFVIALLPFLLWPAFIDNPDYILNELYFNAAKHVAEPHLNPRFFAGQLYNETQHPGVLFYPVSLFYKASFVTFTGTLLSIIGYAIGRKRLRFPIRPVTYWLLVAFGVFYIIQMEIGAKQDPRYVLPALMIMAICAAAGLVALADLLKRAATGTDFSVAATDRLSKMVYTAPLALAVGFQAITLIPFAPDYGAHHNYLFGGNRTAIDMVEIGADQNEGILYIMNAIHEQADLSTDSVGAESKSLTSISQYYAGDYQMLEGDSTLDLDYYVFNTVNTQRKLRPDRWLAAWEAYGDITPLLIVNFDGVEYMRVVAPNLPEPAAPQIVERGWPWLIAAAWLWTAVLIGGMVWALVKMRSDKLSIPAPEPVDLRSERLARWLIVLAGVIGWLALINGARLLWQHESHNPVILGRFEPDFFVVFAGYHLIFAAWTAITGWLIASQVRGRWDRIDALWDRLVRSKPLIHAGVLVIGWLGMIAFLIVSAGLTAIPADVKAALVLVLIVWSGAFGDRVVVSNRRQE
ncbi:MAG: glycosyltransferase family 39 protein [Anaerolineae bacterium]|nr:glycosyltransferase family 39 protein [Anaerolineae bacterium]